jgi:hypothetical protein
MPAKKDEKVVKDIIKRYGSTLDLKASPYLIVEIIRQYGDKLAGLAEADCLPPGGPPPKKFDPGQLTKELKARIADLRRVADLLDSSMKPAGKSAAKTKKI